MPKITTSLSISFGIFFLVALAAADDGGSFCAAADDPAFCNKLTGGAGSWDAAMTNAIKEALGTINSGKAVVKKMESKLPEDVNSVTKESITSTCNDILNNASDNLKQCLEFVKNDPYNSLNVHLSGIMFSDCTDGYDEFGLDVPTEATEFGDEIGNLISTLLVISNAKK